MRRWVATGLWLAACGAHGQMPCKRLAGSAVEASRIALPTLGAPAVHASIRVQGEATYCRIKGEIRSVDPRAQAIVFEVNLPEAWNGNAVQFGGGTFDGWLGASNGLGHGPVALRSSPTPLERGYATFGSDSGHHARNPFLPDALRTLDATFARNAEQQRNFAGDALKKVHDVAVALMQRRYGRPPQRMFFLGGSTGGREALWVTERYPLDYDGVLAAYAAWDQIELDLQFIRTSQALYATGGFLGGTQTRLIEKAVFASCDAQDGLEDGIISDPAGCKVDVEALTCASKQRRGCLSPAQRNTLQTFATAQRTDTPLGHGVDAMPGFNVLAGAELHAAGFPPGLGLLHFPLRNPILYLNSFGYVIGDDVTRNFLQVGHHYDSLRFDVRTGGASHDELLAQAAELDATDTDLRPFAAHGGKLLLVHGTTDTIVPTNSSVDFYQRVAAKMGNSATSDVVRLYLVPGFGHSTGRFDAGFDALGVLDRWVSGRAPADLVVTDNQHRRSRPLCEWPRWPRYNGTGDVDAAASFTCTAPVKTAVNTAPRP